ncbi:MAG: sigma 54-interacting transcriptional regulator [Candidatus Accumulibacter necessarius]
MGDISPAFQAKLLRVLQEGELERVGGGRTLKVDVRLIAATHRDLEAAVDTGDFREDLYYRLNVMPILLPPLRERIEDLPKIAAPSARPSRRHAAPPADAHRSAQRRLAQHHWPGNVRELENCLERAAVMSESGEIDADLIRIDKPRERMRSVRAARRRRRRPRRLRLPAMASTRRRAERARTGDRRARTGRLGAGPRRPPARHDAAADRLPRPDPQHRGQADVTPRRACVEAFYTLAGICFANGEKAC